MKMDFNNMPGHSRIWIYQANRPLKANELSYVNEKLDAFMPQWQSHGDEVKVSFTVLHNQFIIIGLDQHFVGASGCSIDSAVAQIKQIDAQLNVGLLDRLNIAYRIDQEIKTNHLTNFKNSIKAGEIDKQTIIFNNSIQNVEALQNQWEIPVELSWLAKYFQKEPLI